LDEGARITWAPACRWRPSLNTTSEATRSRRKKGGREEKVAVTFPDLSFFSALTDIFPSGAHMKAVKATYTNGQITFSETPPETGPVDVLVVFPEPADDPWQAILTEQAPRPAFVEFAKECLEKIAKGKAKPLELDQL
jgi:hypothetical protein